MERNRGSAVALTENHTVSAVEVESGTESARVQKSVLNPFARQRSVIRVRFCDNVLVRDEVRPDHTEFARIGAVEVAPVRNAFGRAFEFGSVKKGESARR